MADPLAADPTGPQVNEPRTTAGIEVWHGLGGGQWWGEKIAAIEAEVREQIFRHNGLIADPLAEAAERGTPRSLSDAQQPPAANSEPPPLDYDRLVEAGFLDAYLNINGVEDEAEAERLLREDMAAYSGQPQPALPSEPPDLILHPPDCDCPDCTAAYRAGAEPEPMAPPSVKRERAEGTSFGEAGDPLTPVLLELAERYHSGHSEVGTPCHCNLCYELAEIRARLSSQSPDADATALTGDGPPE